jgi:hypothetical protein
MPPIDHDALYHRLFGHPAIVAELLREFVPAPWLAGLDLDGMERLNTKFHADSGKRREGDNAWRIPKHDGGDAYLVLLLEFQSKSDQYMALRVLAYAALLWQQLQREQRLVPGGRLPPLLPIVLYNGDAKWRAPVGMRDLIALPGDSPLWPWQPNLRYYLIEAGAFPEADLKAREGLPALWFRLETAPDAARVAEAADAVMAWLARHPGYPVVRAALNDYLGALLAPMEPGWQVPDDLQEKREMLATKKAERWIEQWKQEGLQAGRQAGLREGRRDGEAAMLLRLLERRFGALPDWTTDRVRVADTEALEGWGLRVLDAGSLDDVFKDETAQQ